MRWFTGVLLILTWCALSACAARSGTSEQLDQSVKAFNRMLRWHELENAGMTYLDPELREEFLKRAENLKKKGLSVTDFRILSTRYTPEKNSGDVLAEFDYFILPSNRVKTVSYRQDWRYMEDLKRWVLKTGLPSFE